MDMRVLAFGEILWDVINGAEHLGGAPFNFAAHIVQCANDSFIISRLGTDLLGKRAFNKSKDYKVDVSLIEWDEIYPTGTVDVTLTEGQPNYTIRENVAYDFINANAALSFLENNEVDVFYFGSLAQRNEASRHALYKILALGKFQHVFYDVNLRKYGYTESLVKASLKMCTIFKLNSDEVPVIASWLTGIHHTQESFCRCIKALYPNIELIIITASEKGCYIFIRSEILYIPGTPVTVSDAVGAGDAFSAAFMHVYASVGDALTAAQVANEVGAYVATKPGAIPTYSSSIKSLLSKYSKCETA
jgi:fructokinase